MRILFPIARAVLASYSEQIRTETKMLRFTLCSVLCLLVLPVTAQEKTTDAPSKGIQPLDVTGRIHRAMQKRISVDFEETTLEDICAWLADQTGEAIQFDPSLEDEGIAIDDRVISVVAKDISLETFFQLVSLQTDEAIDWWIEDEVITIGSQAAAAEQLTSLVFNVKHILTAFKEAPEFWSIQYHGGGGHFGGGVSGGGGGMFSIPNQQPGSVHLKRNVAFPQFGGMSGGGGGGGMAQPSFGMSRQSPEEEISNLIYEATSGPWMDMDGVGGHVNVVGNALCVQTSRRVADQVRLLIDSLSTLIAQKPGMSVVEISREQARTKNLNQTLQKVETVDLDEDLLSDVFAFIAEQFGVNIAIDRRALDDEGIDIRDLSVNLSRRKVQLRSILNAITRQHELTFVNLHGVLLITTPVALEDSMSVQIHDARKLMQAGFVNDSFIDMLQGGNGSWQDRDGDGGTLTVLSNGLIVIRQTAEQHRVVTQRIKQLRSAMKIADKPQSSDQILRTKYYTVPFGTSPTVVIQSIQTLIQKDTWNGCTQALIIGERRIAVRHTLAVHKEIDAFMKNAVTSKVSKPGPSP